MYILGFDAPKGILPSSLYLRPSLRVRFFFLPFESLRNGRDRRLYPIYSVEGHKGGRYTRVIYVSKRIWSKSICTVINVIVEKAGVYIYRVKIESMYVVLKLYIVKRKRRGRRERGRSTVYIGELEETVYCVAVAYDSTWSCT